MQARSAGPAKRFFEQRRLQRNEISRNFSNFDAFYSFFASILCQTGFTCIHLHSFFSEKYYCPFSPKTPGLKLVFPVLQVVFSRFLTANCFIDIKNDEQTGLKCGMSRVTSKLRFVLVLCWILCIISQCFLEKFSICLKLVSRNLFFFRLVSHDDATAHARTVDFIRW